MSFGETRCNALLLSFVSFCVIAFSVWVVSAGKRYRETYAQTTEGWRVGSTRSVELTLVKEDKDNLACAADQAFAGLRCGYGADQKKAASASPDDARVLQPLNTTANELFLGAGLWTAGDLKAALPVGRFTVVCNYHIEAVVISASIRFDPWHSFNPLSKTVTAGTLTDCVIPR